jgi:putative membrane protein
MMMGFGLLWLFLVGAIALVAVLSGFGLVSREGKGVRVSGSPGGRTARQILNERFARGEISAEEHEAIREQLER